MNLSTVTLVGNNENRNKNRGWLLLKRVKRFPGKLKAHLYVEAELIGCLDLMEVLINWKKFLANSPYWWLLLLNIWEPQDEGQVAIWVQCLMQKGRRVGNI